MFATAAFAGDHYHWIHHLRQHMHGDCCCCCCCFLQDIKITGATVFTNPFQEMEQEQQQKQQEEQKQVLFEKAA
jgi:hypothetical protein